MARGAGQHEIITLSSDSEDSDVNYYAFSSTNPGAIPINQINHHAQQRHPSNPFILVHQSQSQHATTKQKYESDTSKTKPLPQTYEWNVEEAYRKMLSSSLQSRVQSLPSTLNDVTVLSHDSDQHISSAEAKPACSNSIGIHLNKENFRSIINDEQEQKLSYVKKPEPDCCPELDEFGEHQFHNEWCGYFTRQLKYSDNLNDGLGGIDKESIQT
jgi:hypothetical protein